MINTRQKHAKNGLLEVLWKVTQANELIARQNVFESEHNIRNKREGKARANYIKIGYKNCFVTFYKQVRQI